MSRMKDQRKQKMPKRRLDRRASQTLEIDEQDILEELDDLDRKSLELES